MANATSFAAADHSAPAVIESKNPATGETIGTVPVHTRDDVERAVERARGAFAEWSALSFDERRDALDRWRRALAERADDLADLIHRENGKPRLDAMTEIMMALTHLHHAAARAEKAMRARRVSPGVMANYRATVSYHPLGVIGVIGPWNYPIFTPMGSIAYALAAGNAVVFKPSELTPLVGVMMAEIADEAFTIPHLLQVVTGAGETGGALAGSAGIDKIAFTGSTGTGKRVMAAAAANLTPVLMELGGKDAMIVAEDADVDRAAEAAVFGALTNAGQACISIERVYVASAVYDRFVSRVVAEAQSVRTGGDDADIGAITRPEQIDIIRDHIQDAVDKGARALVGGPDEVAGSLVRPTVLVDVTADMKVMREETFGPVLPIVKVDSAEEGLRLANEGRFGLGSAVFAGNGARRLADRLRAGATAINSVMTFATIPSLPFGGVGDSGFGRIHGDEGLREFTRTKATAEERFANPLLRVGFKQPADMYDRMRRMVKTLYGGGAVDKVSTAIRKLF